MTSIVSSVLAVLPLVLWGVVFLWSPGETEGDELLRLEVSILGRLKMLTVPLIVGAGILVFSRIWIDLHWWSIVAAMAAYVVVLMIPQEYILTTAGIRLGKGPFRRWTEFSGVRRSSSGVLLQGGPRSRSYPIFLGGHREDDEFVHLLRRLVRDSYKGKVIDRTGIPSR